MRFVPIKTKEQQTALMLHRARQLLVRQRTTLSNAIRGHLAELGIVSAKGRNGTAELLRIIADGRVSPAVCSILKVLARQYGAIGTEIAAIDKSIMALHRRHRTDCRDRRLEYLLLGAQSCGLDRVGCRSSTPPVARIGLAASPIRAIDICGGCWWSGQWLLSATRASTEPRDVPGSASSGDRENPLGSTHLL
jgi:hypothetical protein